VDWPAIVTQLRKCGLSYPRLREVTGIPVGTLYNLANGITEEPGYSKGEKLLAYWRQITAHTRDEVPQSFRL
jgi:hypothetical protein